MEREDFYDLFADFLAATDAAVMREGLVGFAKNNKCVARYTGIAIRAEFKKSTGAWEMLDTYDKWVRIQKRLEYFAPASVGGAILVSRQKGRCSRVFREKSRLKSYDAALRVQTRCARVGEERTIAS